MVGCSGDQMWWVGCSGDQMWWVGCSGIRCGGRVVVKIVCVSL